ncbi:DinB superfamily protein [Rosistilla oblonga]|uniref:DinB family protein n=1 Tax=Rosistilla oblonga TaxID=2527990 RepID=UPI00118C313B|nr:DinB family protein [Rosistilla oblonga]QDV13719.1 DinB superfamily protein [Rosistilla oblonga]
MELEAKLFTMMRGVLTEMVDGISDADFQSLPAGGGNSPNWILGHLALCNEFGLMTMGLPVERAEQMMPIYGPGSQPTEAADNLMSKADLVTFFNESADRFLMAVANASDEDLAAERSSPILKAHLPTVGDMVGHLLTTHFGMHIGQLSAWRRSRGMGSVLKI